MKRTIILILCLLTLTSCSSSKVLRFSRFLKEEGKSVTASEYSIFISKFKDSMSEQALLDFQNIYYTKPAISDKKPVEIMCVVDTDYGLTLYKIEDKRGGGRFRLVSINFDDKVTEFKVYTLYEV